jgi:Ca2+/H+ antiporter, TMEM165/GDT1 family
LQALLISTGVVALAEIGDKTQLLAIVLAVRFHRPWPIVAGILLATLANHSFAGALGSWITTVLGPVTLRWVLGVAFLAMAVWTLIPDKIDARKTRLARFGVFSTTLVAFFLAEMGDKTQVATIALAAKYHTFFPVVVGTTLGMLIADVPAVFLGDRLAHRLPVRTVHMIAAAIFAFLGIATLLGAGQQFGL